MPHPQHVAEALERARALVMALDDYCRPEVTPTPEERRLVVEGILSLITRRQYEDGRVLYLFAGADAIQPDSAPSALEHWQEYLHDSWAIAQESLAGDYHGWEDLQEVFSAACAAVDSGHLNQNWPWQPCDCPEPTCDVRKE